ncbi:VOC family protein [Nonomuraea bangladeshensis]|uniref:VOC family protein n=1 Tax=Nonomuraea bangladeshensis TaxID=404385 RepID=UPI0031E34125
MDGFHPRLLAGDFAAAFRFYDAVLPELIGAERVQGTEAGPYAHWDAGGQGVLTLFDREAMARVAGTADLPEHGPAVQDVVMFVSRVADVDAGYRFCLRQGGQAVAPPTDRPEWGPGLRTALLRDPEGNLLELQAY